MTSKNLYEILIDYIPLPKRIQDIRKLYSEEKYFECIILGTQVLEDLAKDFFGSQMDLRELFSKSNPEKYKVVRTYHTIINKQKGREPLKFKLITIIFELMNLKDEGFGIDLEIKDANKLMHKADKVITFRNDLAHKYFLNEKKNNYIRKNLPLIARDCVELAEFLYNNQLPDIEDLTD
jgi:predicted nucleic acid binding AN1-type Zn finger protein